MKVTLTFDFGIDARKALAHRVGESRPKRHEDLRNWMASVLRAELEVIVTEYDEAIACENCGCHPHLPRKCSTCECIWEIQ